MNFSPAANRRGILCMLGGTASFVANDALVKFASQSMPGPQLIFIRGALSVLLVLLVTRALHTPVHVPPGTRGWVAGRALIDAVATMLYLGSLFHLPIANAVAITLTAPLFMTLFAAVFLRERVSLARWLSVCAGFAGVLLVVQPRADGFNYYALVCLLAALFHAARDLMTRRIDAGVPSIIVTLATAMAVTLLSGGITLAQAWQPFSLAAFGVLALASAFLAGGYYLTVCSMRFGELSRVGPFRYSGILFALILGYVGWRDIPNALAWCGIALLVGSGLYMLRPD
ncbi:MAG: EamA/RhaT family transporter, partial [Polaromonas sp.]|nr:EamA/RhaT family transporter [Polaromonas sp.]